MTAWTWECRDREGQAMPAGTLPGAGTSFPTQGDAEAWLSSSWEELAEAGVAAVVLKEEDHVVYGPMSLDSA